MGNHYNLMDRLNAHMAKCDTGGNVTRYTIEENWDASGNKVLTCDLAFEDAYAMSAEALQKSIEYCNYAPLIAHQINTRNLGEHIILRFVVLTSNSDMTITEEVHNIIWRADGFTYVDSAAT